MTAPAALHLAHRQRQAEDSALIAHPYSTGTLSITWTKSSTYGTHFTVETFDTLTGTWTTETLGVNATLTGNQVKDTFPAGDTRKFVRLKLVGR